MKSQLFITIFVLFLFKTQAAKVDTAFVHSKSMNKDIPNIIIKPDAYNKQPNKTFPVIYLLHGAGGKYHSWISYAPEIKFYADTFNFIIVCPDGNETGWYFDSPIDSAMRYETYITKELLKYVDGRYRTNTEKRAITGFSMGGHGAFYLAFRHTNLWCAAGSMSGAMDIIPFKENWNLEKRLGKYEDNPQVWKQNTVINMLDWLEGENIALIFDCGTSDFFYDANKRMHEKMLKYNIPHDYIERPGGHDWNYWKNAIQYHLLFFYRALRKR